MGAPFKLAVGATRRDEALAFIVQQLVLKHSAPTLEAIGLHLKISKSRAQEVVAQLIGRKILGRRPGSHTLYVIDLAHCRHLFVEAYRAAGGSASDPMGELLPRTNVQLPMIAPFRHLPDVD